MMLLNKILSCYNWHRVITPILSESWSLHVPEVCPVVDLSGRIAELGARNSVVNWEVLLGEVAQSLEVNENISPITVHTRDLNVSPEMKEVSIRAVYLHLLF